MICTRWCERGTGIIGRAYENACNLLSAWGDRGGNEDALRGLCGWPFVDLAEKIAYATLVAAGYDEGLLDRAIDGDYPAGWSAGDLDAEMERTRNEAAEITEGCL